MSIEKEKINSQHQSLENTLLEAKKQIIKEQFKFLTQKETKTHNKDNSLEIRRKMKVLDNLSPKNYSQDYISKVCQLLKKKDKNYSHKRKNIHKTTFSFDENNNLYLTLPKFDYAKRIREAINERKLHEEKSKEIIQVTDNYEEADNKQKLEDLIPEFFQHIITKSDDSDKEYNQYLEEESEEESLNSLNEEEKKDLIEKLKTKNKFFKKDVQQKENINSNKNSISTLSQKFHSKQPSGIITSTKQQNVSLMEMDPVIQNIKNLREKICKIKKSNSEKRNKKVIAAEVFYYDKKKWEIQRLKESEKILRTLKEMEKNRKEWNDKLMPPIIQSETINKVKKRYSIQKTLKFVRHGTENDQYKPSYFSNDEMKFTLPQINPIVMRQSVTTQYI